jgi:diguanylate cyclase (GGDEF)-like protein
VLASARSRIAEQRSQSRWDRGRLSVVVPIGVIVAVAIVCVVVAVLTSAQRADEVSLDHEQELFKQAITTQGERVLREIESVAESERGMAKIRIEYDPQWVENRIGLGLQAFFNHDIVVVLDAADRVKYQRFGQHNLDPNWINAIRPSLGPILHYMRGGAQGVAGGALLLVGPKDSSADPRKRAALVQLVLDRPAIVAAVAVGAASNVGTVTEQPPIALSIKFIEDKMLDGIGRRLQLLHLRKINDTAKAGGDHVIDLADDRGKTIASFAWTPSRPGAQIVQSVIPFIAVALAGFALLVGLVLRYMRRTTETIEAGETQLRHLALHDPLCGLPNRIYFSERLEVVMTEVRRGGPTAAVFYIDLDHFKDVNDTLGHHVGDELILNVTQRLSRTLRGNDLVARLGGDEFAIITNCASDSYSLQAISGRIISAVSAPYSINGHNIIIGASVGIAVIDRRSGEAADILRYADMALYRAKNEGRNRACIYDAAMNADLSHRKLLEGDLLHAIENDGLRAAYQPLVNASGDTVVGVEALARWTHPAAGEIPPSDFIPIAEHSGLIIELGEWMLRRACLDGKGWPGIMVAVNVSPLQFRRSDFVDMVERILKETDFDATQLELELTESTLLGNLETTELSMLRLKAIGVRFALDDFGTGYSSLLYLRRFPFDKLKIDSSFVRSIEKAPDAAAIVHAVVSLGRGLGMKVTAEGVETAEQHLFLRAAGVHSMQGYRFGKPGPASEISARLATPDDYRVRSPDEEIALAS